MVRRTNSRALQRPDQAKSKLVSFETVNSVLVLRFVIRPSPMLRLHNCYSSRRAGNDPGVGDRD
jgi:hypothetical protein